MARNLELDRIKEAEKTAFAKKQEAWEKYAKAREEASAAHDRMQKAWQERDSAREMMNREYEEMQSSSSRYREIWNEYGVVRDACNARIESLRNEAELEHREMQNCFDRASNQYQYGDKSMAPVYSQEGRRHKERRDELNARVSELCREVKEARQNAEWRAPKTDNSAFKNAQTRFKETKLCHKQLEAEFKQLKTVRDQLKLEFNEAQNKHKQLKTEFEEKLAGLKKQQKNEREEILDKAGISWMEREDAKIVKKADGTTQVYSGGLGEGDGLGHGHVALDNDGRKTYERKAFAEHGEQNYVKNNSCNTLAIGTDLYEGMPAKIRKRKDGKTDIFFTDSGNYGDGPGHGHIVINEAGSVIYMRDQWQDKNQGQYLIDGSKDHHTRI